MKSMDIYAKLPIPLQNLACSVRGLNINRTRYAPNFHRLLAEYEARASWSYEQLCEYRDAKLRGMIAHCYNTVPYYHRLFNAGGINPDSIRRLDDLSVLPILTKAVVNRDPSQFLSSAVEPRLRVQHHTSGTTGSSFIFQTTLAAMQEQWAVWWRYRRALGIRLDTRMAMFGVQRIVPSSQTKPPFWRYNRPNHQTYFSVFHESDANLGAYFREINDKQIPWIHGFPSCVTALAVYMLKHDLRFDRPLSFVTLGGENVLETQQRAMTEAFGVEPYQHYGMCEGVANFSQTPAREMFVDEDYAAMEFVPSGSRCEIIGSTLTNYAMPLLRWSVGDIADCQETARGRLVTAIDGRNEDAVRLPSGRQISRLDHIFKDTVGFGEVQLIQHEDYSLDVCIVKRREDVSRDEELAMAVFDESFGRGTIPIRFVYVDHLECEPNGKFRFVKSKLS